MAAETQKSDLFNPQRYLNIVRVGLLGIQAPPPWNLVSPSRGEGEGAAARGKGGLGKGGRKDRGWGDERKGYG